MMTRSPWSDGGIFATSAAILLMVFFPGCKQESPRSAVPPLAVRVRPVSMVPLQRELDYLGTVAPAAFASPIPPSFTDNETLPLSVSVTGEPVRALAAFTVAAFP